MSSLSHFISNFLKNKGHFVFLSFLIAKICGFATSIILIRLLTKENFGVLSIVLSLLVIFMPLSGFGAPQALLRFGVLTPTNKAKNNLSRYLLSLGFWRELILVGIFLFASVFYLKKYDYILIIFFAGAFRLVGYYFVLHIQSYYRIINRNQVFSIINNVVNIAALISTIVFTYFLGFYGYLISFAFVPFLSLLWLKKNMWKGEVSKPENSQAIKEYGIFTSITALTSEAIFALDLLLLSVWMNESAVADYKVAILLPANVTFLATSFLQTDFPQIAKNHLSKSYLTNYIKNYLKIFIPICISILVVFYFGGSFIMNLLFGEKYHGNSIVMLILMLGFTVGMLCFNLFGNMLPAVGKVRVNTYVSIISLILLFSLSYYLTPKFGIEGMAISMTSTIILSGIIYAAAFFRYLQKLKN